MTHDDILTDELQDAGWSYGHGAFMDTETGKLLCVADAHKGDMKAKAHGECLQDALLKLRTLTPKMDNSSKPDQAPE